MEARKLLVVLVAVALAGVGVMKAKVVGGRVYTVGDEEEWRGEANYERWANKYNFSVGDVLGTYVKGEHNVYEVREEAYRRCGGGGNEVVGRYESGEDEIELREGRKYWFICNVAGHCLGGMRFAISVLNHTAPPAAATPPPSPSPNSSPSPSSVPYSIPLTIPILHCLILVFSPIIISSLPQIYYITASLLQFIPF